MDLNWLKNLEKQVQAATEEIEALRKENRICKTKVKQLEQKLTEARRRRSARRFATGSKSSPRASKSSSEPLPPCGIVGLSKPLGRRDLSSAEGCLGTV